MSGFVGTKQISSPEELQALLQQYATQESCYFLRWPHRVSGFVQQLPPEFDRAEGQLFDRDRELRWQPNHQGFAVLILSTQDKESGFSSLGRTWRVHTRKALLYPKTETRFPRGFVNQGSQIAQRYFQDAQTAIVHFVALTVVPQAEG